MSGFYNVQAGILNYFHTEGQRKLNEGQMNTTSWAFLYYFYAYRAWSNGWPDLACKPLRILDAKSAMSGIKWTVIRHSSEATGQTWWDHPLNNFHCNIYRWVSNGMIYKEHENMALSREELYQVSHYKLQTKRFCLKKIKLEFK